MKVGLLTQEQKNSLVGQLVKLDWYFNPFLASRNPLYALDWVISTEEIDNSIFPENEWVKSIPIIEYVKPISGDTENYFTQFFSGNTND